MSEVKNIAIPDGDRAKLKRNRPVFFAEIFSKRIMPKIYGFGAAVAIMGAMFKLLSLPGGAFMLGAGLSAEAFIFFISAFEKPAKEFDWSIVFPQLDKDFAYEHGFVNDHGSINYNSLNIPFSLGQQRPESEQQISHVNNNSDNLTSLLEKCHVDQESLNKLGSGIKNLSSLCSDVGDFAKTTVDWRSFSENFDKVNESIEKMANLGININASLLKIDVSFGKFTEQGGFTSQMVSKTNEFNEGLSALSSKITELNKSYDNVIRALRG
ncbi:MAG: gliding motility protein GldL [Cytophagales bacterium]|jgi:gliding motility-associated protein GldL|nr:gliding motility protein GldL [Cytophagales bacterium]